MRATLSSIGVTARRDPNGWYLQRYLLSADAHFSERWRLFAEAQAALENGRTGGPRPYDKDDPDIHQFFLDYHRSGASSALTIRAGRQELQYGSGRLVEVRYGLNTRISFDGLKASLQLRRLKIDSFVTRPTLQRTGFFNDVPNSHQIFWGVYAVAPYATHSNIDVYYLGTTQKLVQFSQGTAKYLSHTVGSRWASTRTHWDFDEEANFQFGTFGADHIRAGSISGQNGYTFSSTWASPRVALRSDLTSGDRNPADGHLGSFYPLFPKGKYFGEADLVAQSMKWI